MVPPAASSPIKEVASRSTLISYQSVLDWASPDEERDNPGKLDVFGEPLASFHELRTREFNKEPGQWTVKHAAHVARWEFHQAGYTLAQLREPNLSMKNDQLKDIIYSLSFILFKLGHKYMSFAQASAKVVSLLEKTACLAVESNANGSFDTETDSWSPWFVMLPSENFFLATKFFSPTGALPESLLQSLKTLHSSDCLQVEEKYSNLTTRKAILKVGDDAKHQAEKDATQLFDAAPSKNMSFDTSSSQVPNDKTIDDGRQKSNACKNDKKRKFSDGHLDESLEAAVEKKLASYEVLLDNYIGLTDHLVQCLNSFSDLPEKAAQLKQRREELKAAVTRDLHSSKSRS